MGENSLTRTSSGDGILSRERERGVAFSQGGEGEGLEELRVEWLLLERRSE